MKSTKKIPKTFIGFLIASFIIWVLITFSKEYKTVIFYEIQYKNIPQNKLLQETPLKNLEIVVKATGFKLLGSKLFDKKIVLEVNKLQQKKGTLFYFLPNKQFSKIENQLLPGVFIEEILKDTIYLNLGFLASKKVALKPNLDLSFQVGYDLLESVTVSPDSIVISGPENQLKEINALDLKTLKLDNIKTDFSNELSIIKPLNMQHLKLSTSKATVSAKIDKFTEGNLEVSFSIKNLPSNVKLTKLSNFVTVTFVVALTNFTKVSADSFVIECDYKMSENNELSYLIPKVILQPDFVRSVKIIPTKIDFLIQK